MIFADLPPLLEQLPSTMSHIALEGPPILRINFQVGGGAPLRRGSSRNVLIHSRVRVEP